MLDVDAADDEHLQPAEAIASIFYGSTAASALRADMPRARELCYARNAGADVLKGGMVRTYTEMVTQQPLTTGAPPVHIEARHFRRHASCVVCSGDEPDAMDAIARAMRLASPLEGVERPRLLPLMTGDDVLQYPLLAAVLLSRRHSVERLLAHAALSSNADVLYALHGVIDLDVGARLLGRLRGTFRCAGKLVLRHALLRAGVPVPPHTRRRLCHYNLSPEDLAHGMQRAGAEPERYAHAPHCHRWLGSAELLACVEGGADTETLEAHVIHTMRHGIEHHAAAVIRAAFEARNAAALELVARVPSASLALVNEVLLGFRTAAVEDPAFAAALASRHPTLAVCVHGTIGALLATGDTDKALLAFDAAAPHLDEQISLLTRYCSSRAAQHDGAAVVDELAGLERRHHRRDFARAMTHAIVTEHEDDDDNVRRSALRRQAPLTQSERALRYTCAGGRIAALLLAQHAGFCEALQLLSGDVHADTYTRIAALSRPQCLQLEARCRALAVDADVVLQAYRVVLRQLAVLAARGTTRGSVAIPLPPPPGVRHDADTEWLRARAPACEPLHDDAIGVWFVAHASEPALSPPPWFDEDALLLQALAETRDAGCRVKRYHDARLLVPRECERPLFDAVKGKTCSLFDSMPLLRRLAALFRHHGQRVCAQFHIQGVLPVELVCVIVDYVVMNMVRDVLHCDCK